MRPWMILLFAAPALGFVPPEHKRIADAGAARALASAGLPWKHGDRAWVKASASPRADGAVWLEARGDDPIAAMPGAKGTPVLVWAGDAKAGDWFTFGDLVAIYGDMREKVACDPAASACRFGKTRSSHARLRELAKNGRNLPGGKTTEEAIAAAAAKVTDADTRGAVAILFRNGNHFSTRGVQRYAEMHRAALASAQKAGQSGDLRWLWAALHQEAAGLHSLTDLFALGHMVVHRHDSGSMARLLSIRDGLVHNAFNKAGATVANLAEPNRKWRAFGDHKLVARVGRRILNPDQGPMAVRAVETALKTVLHAWEAARARRRPDPAPRPFEALRLLPICIQDAQLGRAARMLYPDYADRFRSPGRCKDLDYRRAVEQLVAQPW